MEYFFWSVEWEERRWVFERFGGSYDKDKYSTPAGRSNAPSEAL